MGWVELGKRAQFMGLLRALAGAEFMERARAMRPNGRGAGLMPQAR